MLPVPMIPAPSFDVGGWELATEERDGEGAALRRASFTAVRLGVHARGFVIDTCDDAPSDDARCFH